MAIKNVLLIGSALALTACGASSPAAVAETNEAGASHSAALATVGATASASVDPLAVCEGVEPDAAPVELTVEARSYAFDTDRLEGPRQCQPFVITFTNNDEEPSAISTNKHDIDVREGNVLGPLVFDGELVGGGGTIRYEVPGLPAGEHYFYCSEHTDGMNGTLAVVEQ